MASVWPDRLTPVRHIVQHAADLAQDVGVGLQFGAGQANIGRFCSSTIWMRRPSVVMSISSCA
jgi:hypothetical protein